NNPVIDFADYIAERTERFTGRKEVFQAVDRWLADRNGSRYFVIVGEPGSGKTAIAARLLQFSTGEVAPRTNLPVLTGNFLAAAHFCSARDRRWVNPLIFAESLAQQLAARFPDYARALTKPKVTRPKEEHLQLTVEQTIRNVFGGQVTGAWIEK